MGRELPLGLGWKRLSGPVRICFGIIKRYVDGRVVPTSVKIAAGAFRRPPVRTGDKMPPGAKILQRDRPIGHAENQRARLESFRRHLRYVVCFEPDFGRRHIARRSNELRKIGI